MLVLVTGATGFLGRRVVWELLGRGHQVRALAHSRPRQDLFPEGSVDWIQGSVSDTNTLALACHRADAVVHLVAIIRQRKGATFDQVNRQGAANLAAAAKASGTVGKLVHVSVIGAADAAASAYLRSKWQGEKAMNS